jgi:hypothetical protein
MPRQELFGLVERQRKFGGAQLGELAAQSPSRQRRARISPRRDDQAESAGAVSDEEVEALHHQRILHEMKVVEHKPEWTGQAP